LSDFVVVETLDGKNTPPPVLKQAFHYSAGLSTQLFKMVDNNSCGIKKMEEKNHHQDPQIFDLLSCMKVLKAEEGAEVCGGGPST
jgi:hypothetical protein